MSEELKPEIESTGTLVKENALPEELILVTQLPIIVQQLQIVKAQIEYETAYALSLEVTEDNYKEIKKIRAELNKSFNELESKRKEVKSAILAPYNEFEDEFKRCVTNVFKPAEEQLKERISAVENGLKEAKREEAETYFKEYIASKNIDFLTFAHMGLNITLNSSKKSLKEKIKSTIDKVCDDLEMIETQEYKTEILVEYKRSLNVSQAILAVNNRMKAIAEERRKREEARVIAEQKAANAAKVDKVLEETADIQMSAPIPTVMENPEVPAEEAVPTEKRTKYVLSFKVETYEFEHMKKIKSLLDELKKEGAKYEQL